MHIIAKLCHFYQQYQLSLFSNTQASIWKLASERVEQITLLIKNRENFGEQELPCIIQFLLDMLFRVKGDSVSQDLTRDSF